VCPNCGSHAVEIVTISPAVVAGVLGVLLVFGVIGAFSRDRGRQPASDHTPAVTAKREPRPDPESGTIVRPAVVRPKPDDSKAITRLADLPPRDYPADIPPRKPAEPLAAIPAVIAPAPPPRHLSHATAEAEDEVTPELKALLTKLLEDAKSRTVATRVGAYKALGDLGEKAKSVRRVFCQGMLDPNQTVRVAAADGLKKVDETIYKLALGILINRDPKDVVAAGKLGAVAEPLVPLLVPYAVSLAPMASVEPGNRDQQEAREKLMQCVSSMVAIAPDDLEVNRSVITLLANPAQTLRGKALEHVSKLHHKKLALQNVMAIAVNGKNRAANRVAAVNLAPELVDENTTPGVRKSLESLRFDSDPKVRDAVAAALAKLK
jgi:hypothetical protein